MKNKKDCYNKKRYYYNETIDPVYVTGSICFLSITKREITRINTKKGDIAVVFAIKLPSVTIVGKVICNSTDAKTNDETIKEGIE